MNWKTLFVIAITVLVVVAALRLAGTVDPGIPDTAVERVSPPSPMPEAAGGNADTQMPDESFDTHEEEWVEIDCPDPDCSSEYPAIVPRGLDPGVIGLAPGGADPGPPGDVPVSADPGPPGDVPVSADPGPPGDVPVVENPGDLASQNADQDAEQRN